MERVKRQIRATNRAAEALVEHSRSEAVPFVAELVIEPVTR
jgi:hypothetical protein